MLTFKDTKINGFEEAIALLHGTVDPFEESDSSFCEDRDCSMCMYAEPRGGCNYNNNHHLKVDEKYVVGEYDFELILKEYKKPSGFEDFLKYITVTCWVTGPYGWFDRLQESCVYPTRPLNYIYTMEDLDEDLLSFLESDDGYHLYQPVHDLMNGINKSFEVPASVLLGGFKMTYLWKTNYYELRKLFFQCMGSDNPSDWDLQDWINSLPESDLITADVLMRGRQ